MTLAGAMSSSCNKQPGQKKEGPLLIDFIGPENYFPVYHSCFKRIKNTSLHFKTLEQALFTGSDGAVVLLPLVQKASVILMLLEMDKDILTPFPLAKDYTEFDAIQKQCNLSNRRIAILDPVRFWEPVLYFTNYLQRKIQSVKRVEFTTNPGHFTEINARPADNYLPPAAGFSGNTAGMVRLISSILRMNPSTLISRNSDHQNTLKTDIVPDLELVYDGISLFCRNDKDLTGWIIEFSGNDLSLSLDSEGSVRGIDNETGKNETRWDKDFKLKAFVKNINDFITTIRTGKEPEINSLDGMAGIAMNLAAMESAKTGEEIRMIV